MRSLNDHDFAEYLKRIRDGIEPTISEDLVHIKAHMAIPWKGEASLHKLIEETFPNLQSHRWDASYMVERAILTPKNHDVQQLNDIIIISSFDEVEGDTNNMYQQEYLNSISTGGLPPYTLKVKKGAPLMLLRNIDPKLPSQLLDAAFITQPLLLLQLVSPPASLTQHCPAGDNSVPPRSSPSVAIANNLE
ncbi:uncharacterized protein LOC110265301 [Arachis ipaensis]|uniref:uncharacterized protein LOC110265301 n=1 Tax=Arachis ipaensis TaxID=130454 RepID=UPI000A2B7480|nr:uncharacterized protein LOC110265301 [Arachis ipaensis]